MCLPKLREECGVVGIFGHPEAANLAYLALYALQHRGQESAGIAVWDGKEERIRCHRGMGLVQDVFPPDILDTLTGSSVAGHVRYSTTGTSCLENAQPFFANYARGWIAIAHNGNLVNAQWIRDRLEQKGAIFQSTSDTEVIVHLIASSAKRGLLGKVIEALKGIKGAYSLVILTENALIAARDPHGFRPLALGKLKDGWIVASETCAFDLVDAEYVREVEPGEVLVIRKEGLRSHRPFPPVVPAQCVFEYIYFARPDSLLFGQNVYDVRKEFGRQIARESAVDADMVIPVPDSGVPAAIGYGEETGLSFQTGLIRNHYVGRTFIEPRDHIRHFGVRIKLNPVKSILKGKRVVVVDDSIVRGTTSRKIIGMVRAAGAKEVHMRISSPRITHPCFYGVDTPTREQLVASAHTDKEIAEYITADSLAYLSLEGLHDVAERQGGSYCFACFTGRYPVSFTFRERATQLALFGRDWLRYGARGGE